MSLKPEELLGLRLEDAESLMRAEGRAPTAIVSCAPRCQDREGSLRVVRVQGDTLCVCAFPDGMPSINQDGCVGS